MRPGDRQRIFYEFERWGFDQRGWSPRTREQYYTRAKRADGWLQANRNVSLFVAKSDDLKAFLFSTTKSARARNNVRQALVGFGDFLVDRGFHEVNPALTLPRLREPDLIPKALDVDQARQIVAAAKALGPMTDALMCVFLYAGLRRAEAQMLEWRDVDLERGWLRFIGKGHKQRVVPLHDRAHQALDRWRLMSLEARWVFRHHGMKVAPSPRPICATSCETLATSPGLSICTRTYCAIPLRRACWREAPTYAALRKCSGIAS